MSTTPAIVRDLVELAAEHGLTGYRLALLVFAANGTGHAARCFEALAALDLLRRLDDGTLDVATLLDEPVSNLDAARESYVEQYEAQLDAACRALAGES